MAAPGIPQLVQLYATYAAQLNPPRHKELAFGKDELPALPVRPHTRVWTAPALGGELKNISRCLKQRPAKADKTALITAFAAASAACTGVLRGAFKDGTFTLDVWSLLLLSIAVVAAYAHWRKYSDAKNAKDAHLDAALEA